MDKLVMLECRRRLRGLAADTGNDGAGNVTEFYVAVLRRGAQDSEGAGLSAVLPRHYYPEGLVDHGPRGQRGSKLLDKGRVRGQADGERQGPRGILGESRGALGFGRAEGRRVPRVQVEGADPLVLRPRMACRHGPLSSSYWIASTFAATGSLQATVTGRPLDRMVIPHDRSPPTRRAARMAISCRNCSTLSVLTSASCKSLKSSGGCSPAALTIHTSILAVIWP